MAKQHARAHLQMAANEASPAVSYEQILSAVKDSPHAWMAMIILLEQLHTLFEAIRREAEEESERSIAVLADIGMAIAEDVETRANGAYNAAMELTGVEPGQRP